MRRILLTISAVLLSILQIDAQVHPSDFGRGVFSIKPGARVSIAQQTIELNTPAREKSALRLGKSSKTTDILVKPLSINTYGGLFFGDTRTTNTYSSNGTVLTELHETFDKQSNSWLPSARTTNEIDAGENITTATDEHYGDGKWSFEQRRIYTYNQMNQVTSVTYQVYWDGAWKNNSRETNIYNESGELTSRLQESFDGVKWQPTQRTTVQFNGFGQIVEELSENYFDGVWTNSYRYIYAYDDQKSLSQSLYEMYENGAWTAKERSTFTADAQGRTNVTINEEMVSGSWVIKDRQTETYDAQGLPLVVLVEVTKDGSVWSKSSRVAYEYSPDAWILSLFTETYSEDVLTYANKCLYTYDFSAKTIRVESFGQSGDQWLPADGMMLAFKLPQVIAFGFGYKMEINYAEFNISAVDDSRQEAPVTYKLEQNYPNPFNPSTTIKYSVSEAGNISLKVFDILGNQVAILADGYRSAGSYEAVFDASGLTSGMYFYRLSANGNTLVRKMTLLK